VSSGRWWSKYLAVLMPSNPHCLTDEQPKSSSVRKSWSLHGYEATTADTSNSQRRPLTSPGRRPIHTLSAVNAQADPHHSIPGISSGRCPAADSAAASDDRYHERRSTYVTYHATLSCAEFPPNQSLTSSTRPLCCPLTSAVCADFFAEWLTWQLVR